MGWPTDRFACGLDVELDAGRTRVYGRGLDLTTGALSCSTKQKLEPGTTVQVQMRLVLEWGSSETLSVSGQVLWLTETEGMWQIGVLLTELGGEARQRLGVLLKVLTGSVTLPAPSR